MPIYGLLPALQQSAAFKQLIGRLKNTQDSGLNNQHLTVGGAITAAVPYVLSALQVALKRPILAILPEADQARQAFDELQQWTLEPASSLLFPALEGEPYDEGRARPETVRERAAVLAELKTQPKHEGRYFKPLVVTSAAALFPRVTPPEQFTAHVFALEEGQKMAPDALLEEWLTMGFEAEPLVQEPGTFTRRGGILDVFPPAHLKPVRIEFWGDEIESIRSFDPETQLSGERLQTVTFTPVREVAKGLAERAGELLESLSFDGCREEEAGRWRRALEAISLHQKAEDAEFYLRFLFDRSASLLEYLPPDALVVLCESSAISRHLAHLANQAEEARLELAREGDLPEGLPRPYLLAQEIFGQQRVGGQGEGGASGSSRTAGSERPVDVAPHLNPLPEGEEAAGSPLPLVGGQGEGGASGGSGTAGSERPVDVDPHLNPLPEGEEAGGSLLPLVGGQGEGGASGGSGTAGSERPVDVDAHLNSLPEGEEDAHSSLITHHSSLALTAAISAELDLGFRTASSYGGKLKSVANDVKRWAADGQRVVLLSLQGRRLSEQLGDEKIVAPVLEELTSLPEPGSVTLVNGALKEGWRNPELQTTLLTDIEVFGWSKPRRTLVARSAAPPMVLSDITPGDFVVHVEHGVGRYAGLVHRELNGVGREYLVLQYAGTDQLFVPVEQIDRISRYIGVGDHKPTLNKLGTQDWDRAKTRVKQSIVHLAAQLLALYSQRELAPGFGYPPDTPWQDELEASFPYVETPDQLRAISEIKEDMEKPRPMDRLLCGDVGFGKTEVAVRAAFKVVMAGKQVAVLVPTTVLAEQHLNTFRDRMKSFPVKVEMLSRFRSPAEQRRVIAEAKSGAVDVLVGTHRMLQPDVHFKDLGLLVVDEEQRFGVMHKERLKELRKDVDVLTMTATPIPRTLNMAMVGVRDMSVIETAPDYRQPIKTYLEPYRDEVVRDAILREIQRGGQVYYVHNRVETMAPAIQKLRKLVPEATFIGAHGQMDEGQLEKVMNQFEKGEYDVLVCSTIIESGLDIPNVNTIIINEAGRLGLAQLYQLRGRVGRSATHAYAYLLFKPDVPLTDQAEKRLRTIFETTDLGAGFKIAMKDLEIRGAGNLLGPEQHGQMNSVGFDLYCKLLAESIQELKGEEIPDTTKKDTITVDVGLDALIPDDYVTDLSLKMNLYQRLAMVTTLEQSALLLKEIRDRFGPLPDAVRNLFFLLDLKLLALEAGVEVMKKRNDEIQLVLKEGTTLDRYELGKRFGSALRIGTLQLHLRAPGEQWREKLPKLLEALRLPAGRGQAEVAAAR